MVKKQQLRELCRAELQKANLATGTTIWDHLERAHILSQPLWDMHFLVHFEMLKAAIRQKKFRELVGQLPRLILASPSSILNLAPSGNPGTTRVGMFAKAEIPEDLRALLH